MFAFSKRIVSRRRSLWAGLVVILFFLPCIVAAQEVEPAAGDFEDEAGLGEKFHVFGYVTQAFAMSRENQVTGISKDGTFDYRNLAVQLRYAATEKDGFTLQLSNERVGESPVQHFKSDVALEWAYYQRELGASSSLRIGRVPIPLGIYNETRDVGTVLPFFRPPLSLYGEIAFASESADGLTLSHTFAASSPWYLDADVYVGEWELIEMVGSLTARAQAKRGYGAQLWLHTPVPGLRFGAGAQRFNREEGVLQAPGDKTDWKSWHASGEGSFQRFAARAEYRRVDFGSGSATGYYGQASLRLTPKLQLHVQEESLDLVLSGNKIDLAQDSALGASYQFSSRLVLKAEIHQGKGFFVEGADSSELPSFEEEAARRAEYGILSLSISF